jgi:uncharacterized protein (TIGR02452 family)
MDRSKRLEIAEETNEILRNRSYVTKHPSTGENTLINLSEVLDAACQGTQLHRVDDSLNIPAITTPKETKLYMTAENTLQCLHRLHGEGNEDVMILNFASAKNPGGGLNRGSWEQEENLAAVSGLITCLSTPQAKPFYEFHKQMTKPGKSKPGVLMYSSNMIYSPYVPVFRNREMELSCQPFTCNIISSCCVNYNTGMLGKKTTSQEDERAVLIMQSRVLRVLQVAVHHGAETLILGPWGCGINKNSPREVAKAFNGALLHPDMEGRFKEVVFAVPYEESTNKYKSFANTFEVETI